MLSLTCFRHDPAITEPPQLERSGPHVKANCYKCGKYIKFTQPHHIGGLKEIKLMIWSLADRNEEVISDTKEAMGIFDPPPENTLGLRIAYHNLYCELLSMCDPKQKEMELNKV